MIFDSLTSDVFFVLVLVVFKRRRRRLPFRSPPRSRRLLFPSAPLILLSLAPSVPLILLLLFGRFAADRCIGVTGCLRRGWVRRGGGDHGVCILTGADTRYAASSSHGGSVCTDLEIYCYFHISYQVQLHPSMTDPRVTDIYIHL